MEIRRVFRLFILSSVIVSMLASCTRKDGDNAASRKLAPSSEPLRICTGTTYSILLTIAEQKGLFAAEGLKVEMKPYAIGRDAMEAMLAGQCDVATSADTPVADYGLRRNDLRVISGIAKSDSLSCIVALRESGIRKISQLKGRMIGVTKGTAPHFFLDLVLNKNSLTEKDINLRFMKDEELNDAIVQGKVDAIATTDLNAYKIKEKLREKVNLIVEPGIVLNHGYLTVLDPTLESRKGDLKRMMTALNAAQRIAEEKPDEGLQLFSSYLKVSPAISTQLWKNIIPKLSLDSAMVLTLEDNARWLRERDGGKGFNKSFKEIIKPELLKEVAPESVSF